jgi:hypothetical protein
LTITISFDTATLTGSVSASILGYSLGTAKFSSDKGATIGINVWLAKANVTVSVHDHEVWLQAEASTKFNGSVKFGPTKIIPF